MGVVGMRMVLISGWGVEGGSTDGSKLLTSARVLHSSYDCRASAFSSADVAARKEQMVTNAQRGEIEHRFFRVHISVHRNHRNERKTSQRAEPVTKLSSKIATETCRCTPCLRISVMGSSSLGLKGKCPDLGSRLGEIQDKSLQCLWAC
eukprot:3933828-Rhodomonas_salina.4